MLEYSMDALLEQRKKALRKSVVTTLLIIFGPAALVAFLFDKYPLWKDQISVLWILYVICLFIFFPQFRKPRGRFYTSEDAEKIIEQNIAGDVTKRIGREGIKKILQLKFEWEDKMTAGGGQKHSNPFTQRYWIYDDYIKAKVREQKLGISEKDIAEVLKAEEIYLKQQGVIE